MNPRIAASYDEIGRWLQGFATSHAKRESARLEAAVEMEAPRVGRSYGLRLMLGPSDVGRHAALIELAHDEVAQGRTRFAWCADLAGRIRSEARRLLESEPGRSRSA